ncbi:unnamed protein product [Durusdinium trenchii]|uniref:Uncharacterized protein n=1 Tax=Durusdinium trenchii TaxID=1381693 RepID=A0ABP0L439_9DINO
MQLDIRSMLRHFGFEADLRTQCIILAGILTAVLPLEIHHLLAMVLGAAGYMFLQQLEPSVRRRSELLEVKKPVRRSAGSAGSGVGAEEKMEKENAERVERRPKEVKKPSVVPVQAPKFQAIGWDAEVAAPGRATWVSNQPAEDARSIFGELRM